MSYYFGEPWPSGVCDDGEQVPTPVGTPCGYCEEPIGETDRGSMQGVCRLDQEPTLEPMHRECSLRGVAGGAGHLADHDYWCTQKGDPDAGLTRRQSALLVWGQIVLGIPIAADFLKATANDGD